MTTGNDQNSPMNSTFPLLQIVLTAAHCQPAFQIDVIIGSADVFGRDGAERIPVDILYPHENYVPGPEENDIMVCRYNMLYFYFFCK